MKEYSQTKIINAPQEKLFEIVTKVSEYKNFIPGCKDIEIIEKDGNKMIADLTAGIKGIDYKYRSHITMQPHQKVLIKKEKNPNDSTIETLESYWEFEKINDETTKVNFCIRIDIKSTLMRIMLESFFDEISKKVMNSFINRAQEIAA